MRTEIIIDAITDEIISRMDPNFSALQKIRFIYLELGKYIEKNITFFKNNDLGEYALTDDDKYNIYDNDYIDIRKSEHNTQFQIICKSAARFLKTAFDKVGVESDYLRTTVGDNGIYHWFVVAKDDNDNQYFLTLAADLPYIKNNMPTKHFGNSISYLDSDGQPSYLLPENENIILSDVEDGYQEVAHKTLDKKELYDLDCSIGYSRLYEISQADLVNGLKNRYAIYLEENSDAFKIYLDSFNAEDDHSFKVDDITEEQIELFKNRMFDYISNNSKVTNYNLSSKDYLVYLLESSGIKVEDTNLSIPDLLKKYKKELKKIEQSKYTDVIKLYQNVLAVEGNLKNLLRGKKEIASITDEKAKKTLEIRLKRLVISTRELLYIISYYFIDSNLITKSFDSYIPTEYVVRKFLYMFPLVFDCNYEEKDNIRENNKTVSSNNFSIQNYSEQIVIIKLLLTEMFPELTLANSVDIEDYNYLYSPVDNRIQAYPIINRETKEYCIGFYFGKKAEEGEIYYIYTPSTNKLERRNPVDDYQKYYSVSRRFESHNKIEKIEHDLAEKKVR